MLPLSKPGRLKFLVRTLEIYKKKEESQETVLSETLRNVYVEGDVNDEGMMTNLHITPFDRERAGFIYVSSLSLLQADCDASSCQIM